MGEVLGLGSIRAGFLFTNEIDEGDNEMATVAAIQARAGTSPTYQAYQILRVGFAVLPIIAGLDKFFHILVNWDMYLTPSIARLSPVSGHTLLMIVGVVEIAAGILVAIRPRVGAYIVMVWLWGIIVDLLLLSGHYDVALRDFGLSLGALALGRLSADL